MNQWHQGPGAPMRSLHRSGGLLDHRCVREIVRLIATDCAEKQTTPHNNIPSCLSCYAHHMHTRNTPLFTPMHRMLQTNTDRPTNPLSHFSPKTASAPFFTFKKNSYEIFHFFGTDQKISAFHAHIYKIKEQLHFFRMPTKIFSYGIGPKEL